MDLKKLAEEIYFSLNARIPISHPGFTDTAQKEDIEAIIEAFELVQKETLEGRIEWPSEAELIKAKLYILEDHGLNKEFAETNKPLSAMSTFIHWLRDNIRLVPAEPTIILGDFIPDKPPEVSDEEKRNEMIKHRHIWRAIYCDDKGDSCQNPDDVFQEGFEDGWNAAEKKARE